MTAEIAQGMAVLVAMFGIGLLHVIGRHTFDD
jgi:hypothetical protein